MEKRQKCDSIYCWRFEFLKIVNLEQINEEKISVNIFLENEIR